VDWLLAMMNGPHRHRLSLDQLMAALSKFRGELVEFLDIAVGPETLLATS